MGIHYSTIKRAEKMGVTLTEEGDDVVAFWPKRAVRLVGSSPQDALTQMQAAQVLVETHEIRLKPVTGTRLVNAYNEAGQIADHGPFTPHDLFNRARQNKIAWVDENETPTEESPLEPKAPEDVIGKEEPEAAKRSPKGIALDGRIAHKEGTPAGDNPFLSEYEESDDNYALAEKWDAEWDESAEEKDEDDNSGKGTVVPSRYRQLYAELGHPTHCGDQLASVLNNLCLGNDETNLEKFEAICNENGVSLNKYKRSGNGWQGRLRMTGRNLLAKKVYLNGGKLLLPEGIHETRVIQMDADWMATRKFKKPE